MKLLAGTDPPALRPITIPISMSGIKKSVRTPPIISMIPKTRSPVDRSANAGGGATAAEGRPTAVFRSGVLHVASELGSSNRPRELLQVHLSATLERNIFVGDWS